MPVNSPTSKYPFSGTDHRISTCIVNGCYGHRFSLKEGESLFFREQVTVSSRPLCESLQEYTCGFALRRGLSHDQHTHRSQINAIGQHEAIWSDPNATTIHAPPKLVRFKTQRVNAEVIGTPSRHQPLRLHGLKFFVNTQKRSLLNRFDVATGESHFSNRNEGFSHATRFRPCSI